MEKVIIDNLDKNSLYHFTLERNLEEIEQCGLVPMIGENAKNIENTKKVFFSKGELGIIKATEVWLRWLMNRIFGVNDRLDLFKDLSETENKERISSWTKEFLSKEYLNDENKKEKLFAYFYEYLKDRTYLNLDIKEGVEYDSTQQDENKVNLSNNKNHIYTLFAKVMYGEFSDFSSTAMDDWNMHTYSGVGIDKNKIKQVITKDGKKDMLSIVLYLYDKNKNISHNKILLDDFVEYAKKKEALNSMLQEEGNKNAENNNSRENKGKISK